MRSVIRSQFRRKLNQDPEILIRAVMCSVKQLLHLDPELSCAGVTPKKLVNRDAQRIRNSDKREHRSHANAALNLTDVRLGHADTLRQCCLGEATPLPRLADAMAEPCAEAVGRPTLGHDGTEHTTASLAEVGR